MNRKIVDLQIPRPLLDPEKWQRQSNEKNESPLVWISSLAMGSPMAQLQSDVLASGADLLISIPTDFFSSVIRSEPSWSPLIETQLKSLISEVPHGKIETVSSEALSSTERAEWNDLITRSGLTANIRISALDGLRLPTLFDWSREVFPRTFLKLGELVWRKELRDYESQLAPTFASITQLRFWPGHLRQKNVDGAELANRELCFAEVLFSPQADRQGAGPNALLNPTLQVADALAIWRFNSQMQDRKSVV